MGVHIDGYIATAAHTTVVSSNTQEAVTGRAADVVAATHFAYEAALRMLRPGVRVIYRYMESSRNVVLKNGIYYIGFRDHSCYH